jgi:hypothetical protein
MRRFHLFEWEDQRWLPPVFRDFITDHLRYTMNEPMRRPVNLEIANRLKVVLERTRTRRIVDLCAGAGGPLVEISRLLFHDLGVPVEIVVTDLYPNVAAFERLETESGGTITGRYESTSATDVPLELSGLRTVFTALHHFTPDQARLVLADAVRKRQAIAVFEPLERTVRMVILLGVVSFIRGFTHTPRVGKLTIWRFVVTYLFPVAPLVFAWDGMVSALRSYTSDELRSLARSVGGDYRWEAGRFDVAGRFGNMPTTYLVGIPAAAAGI